MSSHHQSLQTERMRPGNLLRLRHLHVERLEDRRMLAGRAADAINLFAIDVYEQMQREQGNLFFSPMSIATGLAMAYAGAAGQTAAEMEQVLHLGTEPGIHDAFNALLSSLDGQTASLGAPDLYVANAMWPHINLPVNAGFIETVGADYGGHVQALDYSNPNAAKDTINEWVEDETRGKIRNLVSDVTPATAMVLTNSIYFKGLWEFPFDPRHTAPGTFIRGDGTSISTPMMLTYFNGNDAVRNKLINGYFVVDMPFDGGSLNADLSMVLIVPPQNASTYLSAELFAQVDVWLLNPGFPTYHELELKLPKFKTEVSTRLNELLIGLGMPSAFAPDAANFSAMTPAPVYVTRVFHKAVVEVNEQGTEAAAATEVQFAICFAKGTPVLTSDGEKPIDQLKPGDLVMARDENSVEGSLQPKLVEKVHHGHAEILELHVGGQVVRTTASHPFFVRGRGWTPAGELIEGDHLSLASGDWRRVGKVVVTQESEPVFNLRVADYHTYFVGGKEWGFALWVHNSCVGQVVVDRPFHFMIRDNTTSTILFMGRINDPLQLQNEVTPIVVDPSADFDGNTMIDGVDFMAWQRGFGKTTNAVRAQGDSDENGNVDSNDLAQWMETFGDIESTASTNLLAVEEHSALPSAIAAPSEEDLINAAMAWGRLMSEDDGALVSSPLVGEFDRYAAPTSSNGRVENWTLATSATLAAARPAKVSDASTATDDVDGWPELVDELLGSAFE
jgi:serpin B